MTTHATPAEFRLTDGLGHNAQNAERWYCVSRDGLATLCKDAADAHETAGQCDKSWPLGGPHRAVLLVDAAEIARLRHALAQSGKLGGRGRSAELYIAGSTKTLDKMQCRQYINTTAARRRSNTPEQTP